MERRQGWIRTHGSTFGVRPSSWVPLYDREALCFRPRFDTVVLAQSSGRGSRLATLILRRGLSKIRRASPPLPHPPSSPSLARRLRYTSTQNGADCEAVSIERAVPWLLNFRARIRATDLNRLVWTCEPGSDFRPCCWHSFWFSSQVVSRNRGSRRRRRVTWRLPPATRSNCDVKCTTRRASASGRKTAGLWECLRTNTSGSAGVTAIAHCSFATLNWTWTTPTGNARLHPGILISRIR